MVYLIDLRTNELIRKLSPSPLRQAEIAGLTFCGGMNAIACVTASNELSLYNTDGNRLASIDIKSDGAIRYAGGSSWRGVLGVGAHARVCQVL